MVRGEEDREFVEDFEAVHCRVLERLAEDCVDHQEDAVE